MCTRGSCFVYDWLLHLHVHVCVRVFCVYWCLFVCVGVGVGMVVWCTYTLAEIALMKDLSHDAGDTNCNSILVSITEKEPERNTKITDPKLNCSRNTQRCIHNACMYAYNYATPSVRIWPLKLTAGAGHLRTLCSSARRSAATSVKGRTCLML